MLKDLDNYNVILFCACTEQVHGNNIDLITDVIDMHQVLVYD